MKNSMENLKSYHKFKAIKEKVEARKLKEAKTKSEGGVYDYSFSNIKDLKEFWGDYIQDIGGTLLINMQDGYTITPYIPIPISHTKITSDSIVFIAPNKVQYTILLRKLDETNISYNKFISSWDIELRTKYFWFRFGTDKTGLVPNYLTDIPF